MDFIVAHQLNVMMVMSGICGFILIFLLFMAIEDRKKKSSFIQIAFFALILLVFDRFAYIYRGDLSNVGYWMVRISNFLVFASIILVENGFNNYLFSIVEVEKVHKNDIYFLKVGRLLAVVGLGLLIASQYLGFYYTFDDMNKYHRGDYFILCYLMPIFITILQFAFIVRNRRVFRKQILISLYLFIGIPFTGSIAQIFMYGVSLTTIFIAVSAIIVYLCALSDQNKVVAVAAEKEIARMREVQEKTNELLHETVEALALAVDAKDAYTHGHSTRVAKYSRKIAEIAGKTEEECEDIYLAGLLHDVGKIGIKDSIINKTGRLTDEEFGAIKQHPGLGNQILSKIDLAENLSIGAHYHHERYDGTGYPERLKGEDIPEIARIIAVADAYDAMTSNRSYREQIPQQQVREEIVKGMGTQFDPAFAKIMLHMIDADEEYQMKEKRSEESLGADLKFEFAEYKSQVSAGIQITDNMANIKLSYKLIDSNVSGIPTLLFYDASNAKYCPADSSMAREMDFVEYGSIRIDGKVDTGYIRDMKHKISAGSTAMQLAGRVREAEIQLVKQDDHFLARIITAAHTDEVIFALHDASRYLYMALTGENCNVEIIDIDVDSKPVERGYIPRIAEKISYIDGPVGDIPNVQIDTWRSDHTDAMAIDGRLEFSFHTMSLPTARRIWHSPIICLYTSDDGEIFGENYQEITMIRMDGEAWSDSEEIVNTMVVSKDDTFMNWNNWKQKNRDGVDCKVTVSYEGDAVKVHTENGGVTVMNHTKLPAVFDKLYCYITGDQCAITDIHIVK